MSERRDRNLTRWVFLTLLASYAWFFGGSGYNQNSHLATARAIVERGSVAIDGFDQATADYATYGGHTYSNKPPGVSVLVAIPYFVLHALRGAPRDVFALTLDLYVCTVVVCSIAGAALGALIFTVLRRRGHNATLSLSTALVIGLGTPVFAYSTMLFLHVPSALLMFAGVACATGLLPQRPVLAGALLGAAVTMNYLAVFAVVAVLVHLVAAREVRRAALLCAGGIPFAVALAAYQYAAFGSPFTTTIAHENPAFHTPGAALGVLKAPSLDALWGITFSEFRGLFFISPVLVIALAGLVSMFRSRDDRPIAAVITGTSVAFLALNASFNGWHGGYAIGPRYLLPIIPLLAIPLAIGVRSTPALSAILAAVSIAFNVAATAVDPQPPDRLMTPLMSYELPALVTGSASDSAEVPPWIRDFYTGHTSTNRVAADELVPFRIHPPGSPASEWASFNLGEVFTAPGSPWSIVPIFVFVSAACAAMFRAARRSDREA